MLSSRPAVAPLAIQTPQGRGCAGVARAGPTHAASFSARRCCARATTPTAAAGPVAATPAAASAPIASTSGAGCCWAPAPRGPTAALVSHGRGRGPRPAAAAAAAGGAAAPVEQRPSSPPSGEGGLPVRRIILLRHADSESSSSTRDHERPISSHGRREAAAIAQRLREMGWAPDLIIASNSRRTKMTLDVMAESDEALANVDAHYLGSLYTVAALDGQTRTHLEECIRSVAGDTANFCVMCVGHNKGWEEAATSFARQAVRLHTASAALFESVGRTWQDATQPDTEWRLVSVVTP